MIGKIASWVILIGVFLAFITLITYIIFNFDKLLDEIIKKERGKW